ncbi:hypothetical protein V2J09_000497 [Rumex salicifolius]
MKKSSCSDTGSTSGPSVVVPADLEPLEVALILLLVHAPEAAVVSPFVGPHDVLQPVLGTRVVPSPVGKQHRRAPHPEEAVGEQHGAVLAGVPVVPDHLGADHHSEVVGVGLEHVPRQVEGNDPGAAPHPPQWLMIIADSEGVGLKMLQFTTSTPTSFARIFVFSNSSSSAPKITIAASSRPTFIVEMLSFEAIDLGMYVSSPIPDASSILFLNFRLSSSNLPDSLAISINCSLLTCSI